MDLLFQVFRLNIIVKCVLYLTINFRLPYENVARVKQFIAELLEPQLLVVGNLGQLEGSVRLQDFPLNDSKQLEWPDPQDEEEEEKGGYYEEANKLHVGEAAKVAIEDGEIRQIVQKVETSHSSALKVEKIEMSLAAVREEKFINLENNDTEKDKQ